MAVQLVTVSGGPHFVMTFGRVQHPVDPTDLEAIVLSHASMFGLTGATAARACGSLREASEAPYFFEGLIHFAARTAEAQATDDGEAWGERIDREMRAGRHLYYLGSPDELTQVD